MRGFVALMPAIVTVNPLLLSSAEGEPALFAEFFDLRQVRRRRPGGKARLRPGRVPRVRFPNILFGRASHKPAPFGQRQHQDRLPASNPNAWAIAALRLICTPPPRLAITFGRFPAAKLRAQPYRSSVRGLSMASCTASELPAAQRRPYSSADFVAMGIFAEFTINASGKRGAVLSPRLRRPR